MKTIGIIPVRKGSNRFPGKNFSAFNETTLIRNTIDKLVRARVDEIYISTDAPEEVKANVVTPPAAFNKLYILDRPTELAQDDSKIEDVILDVIEKLQYPPEEDYIIVLAQVTSPNWSPHSLIYAIHRLEDKNVDSVISVSPDLKPNGAFYVFKKSTFLIHILIHNKIYSPNMYLVQLDWDESADIDFEYQWYIAQTIARGNYDKT